MIDRYSASDTKTALSRAWTLVLTNSFYDLQVRGRLITRWGSSNVPPEPLRMNSIYPGADSGLLQVVIQLQVFLTKVTWRSESDAYPGHLHKLRQPRKLARSIGLTVTSIFGLKFPMNTWALPAAKLLRHPARSIGLTVIVSSARTSSIQMKTHTPGPPWLVYVQFMSHPCTGKQTLSIFRHVCLI